MLSCFRSRLAFYHPIALHNSPCFFPCDFFCFRYSIFIFLFALCPVVEGLLLSALFLSLSLVLPHAYQIAFSPVKTFKMHFTILCILCQPLSLASLLFCLFFVFFRVSCQVKVSHTFEISSYRSWVRIICNEISIKRNLLTYNMQILCI